MIAVLKVYMDESGTHGMSPVVTVAGYIGGSSDWRKWTKRWNITKRPIKVYHANDAQNLYGEFKGWSESDRDELVKRLLAVIAEAEFPGIVIGIHMDEFRSALAGRADLTDVFGTPYGACFQWVVQSLLNLQARTKNTERIAFVHECNDHQGEALESFKFVKEHANPKQTPMEILFGGKADYPPLQAADILAYEGNKRMRDPGKPERRPWKVLNPDCRILAAHYGRENMHELVSRLEKIRDGNMSEINLGSKWNTFLRGDREGF